MSMSSAVKPDIDQLFVQYVSAANSGGQSLGVTVDLEGLLITGNLVGVERYYEAVGEALAGALRERDSGAADELLSGYKEAGKQLREDHVKYEEAVAEGKEDGRGPSFFHMTDARILAGGRLIPTSKGILWRGKIGAVSGFGIGTLSASRDGDT